MNRIAVGEEPLVVLVGEAPDGSTDLFAVSPGGGTVYQITFNRPVESHPALNPAGTELAFFRQPVHGDSTTRALIVMNLANAAEHELDLPDNAGALMDVTWRATGRTLVVRTARGLWDVQVPPSKVPPRPLLDEEAGASAVLLEVAVGDPVYAFVDDCQDGGVCSYNLTGGIQRLSADGSMPFRWGADSVAWIAQDRIVVRPLGPGRSRDVMWTQPPANPREATYAAGPLGAREPETGLVVPK